MELFVDVFVQADVVSSKDVDSNATGFCTSIGFVVVDLEVVHTFVVTGIGSARCTVVYWHVVLVSVVSDVLDEHSVVVCNVDVSVNSVTDVVSVFVVCKQSVVTLLLESFLLLGMLTAPATQDVAITSSADAETIRRNLYLFILIISPI